MSRLGPLQQLVRWGYTGLYLPASPFVLAYWLTRPDSRSRLGEYLGRGADGRDPSRSRSPILVHAVSAGESVAAMPVLKGLASHGHEFFLTTTIQDALEMAAKRGVRFEGSSFFPLDVPFFHRRLLDRLVPAAAIISETDLWPNHLLELGARGIPTYLVNGRVSPKLARGWGMFRPFLGAAALSAFRMAFVQGEGDKDRLVAMGVPADRVHVTGNTKYEIGAPPALSDEFADLHQKLVEDERPLVVAGSTHAPEERLILEALPGAPGARPRLLLVPRDPRRAEEVIALAESLDRTVGRWSELGQMRGDPTPYDVLVVDVMGQLSALYKGANLAYIGGGYGATGGHNFLEAAFHGVTMVGGPDFRNFAADVEVFERGGAFFRCDGAAALQETVWALLGDVPNATARGRRGRDLLDRGATASPRIVEAIQADMLAHPAPGVVAGEIT